jgi:hypothetical protein
MATRKAIIMECDAPGCYESFEHSKDEPAPGYHFAKGYWVLGGGGPIPGFYAHAKECIVPAMEYVIEADWR